MKLNRVCNTMNINIKIDDPITKIIFKSFIQDYGRVEMMKGENVNLVTLALHYTFINNAYN